MFERLWEWDELLAAAQGRATGTAGASIAGFSIDSRTIARGEVFVALRGARDGHAFVPAALAAGAAAAIVAQDYCDGAAGALIRVEDPLKALANIGRAARARTRARIVAVTGSVGKTGTKEMLRLCLARLGKTHAAEKSYNNHWGVPLTLARMPRDSEYAVFEIGMNHAGEITPLAQMVRPHVALITAVEPVHLAHFASVADIARAKAEIFAGLISGGSAVLPRDNGHFPLLLSGAAGVGARIITFAHCQAADLRSLRADVGPNGSDVLAECGAQRLAYRLTVPGEHYVRNSLAALAALKALGVDIARCLPALEQLRAPAGRGARTLLNVAAGHALLIDESYNANPASVRAALAAMATTPRKAFPRRIAVLGDMLELGPSQWELHRRLKDAVEAAAIDLLVACGPMMRLLYNELAAPRQGAWAASSDALVPALLASVRAGDVVMIKGSLGTRMAPLVEAMLTHFGPGQPGG
jgi:UDP-N-acetylmuramoyl-tripeptide--D-alanyl-D-alanine ligase